MSADWVVTLTFDLNPSTATMHSWEDELAAVRGHIRRAARRDAHGIDITMHAPGELVMFDAARQSAGQVARVVNAPPAAMAVTRDGERQQPAAAPARPDSATPARPKSTAPGRPDSATPAGPNSAMPELMSTAEIAAELRVTRQRVYQLRDLAAFPEPLADLRAGAVWDAAAVRKFAQEWERRPGRPRAGTAPRRRG